ARYQFGLGLIFQHALRGFSATIPDYMLEILKKDPRIKYIEPELIFHAFEQTVPTGVQRIKVDLNATANIDGINSEIDVDIAILDSGVDLDHPDLKVVNGATFVPFTRSAEDYLGHGTHVAGIVAALDNDFGVVGVAPGARIHAVKVLGKYGTGGMSSIIAGIDWVAEHADEIEVANMSLGAVGQSQAMREAITNCVNKGVVFVVAAGNSTEDVYGTDRLFGTRDDYIPASYPEVATISALTDLDGLAGGYGGTSTYKGYVFTDDTLAPFSNFSRRVTRTNPVTSPGAAIDFAAPGYNILSTFPGGEYQVMSGTSMASPHAAGCVALYIARYGRAHDAAGVTAIRQAIIDSAESQVDWGPSNTNDPDSNQEGLIDTEAFDPAGPPANLVSISIVPGTISIPKGTTSPLAAIGSFDDESTRDMTTAVTWISSDELVVTINSSGMVTGLNEGVAEITASFGEVISDPVIITVTEPPIIQEVFSDSFEDGEGNWQQDLQNSWVLSSFRSTDGNYSVMVNGPVDNAQIFTRDNLDLSGKRRAILSFDWLIGIGLDEGEYLALDLSSDGGISWEEVRKLSGNVDQEGIWHHEEIDIASLYMTSTFKVRFRATMNRFFEGVYLDMVTLTTEE
ncbi:MAG: S8 family serine peptidase, partial [bacterium]